MTSPKLYPDNPCKEPWVDATGRCITEWYERPVFDLEVEEKRKRTRRGWYEQVTETPAMRRAERQVALDAASKLVGSSAADKLLPEEVRERTGLVVNPLWRLEVLAVSGVLGAKDYINVLKTLAEYAFSKAPSKSINASLSAEDMLDMLRKENRDGRVKEQEAYIIDSEAEGIVEVP